jgi:hypothetical protein
MALIGSCLCQMRIGRKAVMTSAGLAMIHNFADRSLLIPTPRMGTLSDWSLRRGAPLRSPIKIFFGGASRLNNQSDRVSILGVGINSQLQTVFFSIFHFSPPPSYY